MRYFTWNKEKNEKLKEERGISFEKVIFHIEKGNLLEVINHPNQEKYKGQRMFVVNINNYVYLIPFIEDEKETFLKTIIPSRKATRRYFKKEDK